MVGALPFEHLSDSPRPCQQEVVYDYALECRPGALFLKVGTSSSEEDLSDGGREPGGKVALARHSNPVLSSETAAAPSERPEVHAKGKYADNLPRPSSICTQAKLKAKDLRCSSSSLPALPLAKRGESRSQHERGAGEAHSTTEEKEAASCECNGAALSQGSAVTFRRAAELRQWAGRWVDGNRKDPPLLEHSVEPHEKVGVQQVIVGGPLAMDRGPHAQPDTCGLSRDWAQWVADLYQVEHKRQ